jgi:RNA polymerase sigma-70 factor, ECF subfamily
MSEADFLYKLQSGNREAFVLLLDTYQKPVLNICYRFLLNKEDAEDISQEVFIEVFRSIPTFREDSKLSTWIYRIAVAKSLDEIKKQKRKKRITSIGKALGIDINALIVAGKQRPDRNMEENESYSELLSLMNKLPENQRIAFTLSKVEGYTNDEIAEIMQASLVAVDSLIYRAKKKLKSLLNK